MTKAVLQAPILPKLLGALGIAVAKPGRLFAALRAAIRCGRKSDRGTAVNLGYLLEALIVARWLEGNGVERLHAHFGTNSAMVAMLVHELTGLPWSFTVHGPEEFDRTFGITLEEKLASAGFVVAISSFGRSQLWRWMPYDQWSKVHVVHCGLDDIFMCGEPVPAAKPFQIVCVGRLCEQKGQLLLVDAARLLKAQGLEFGLVFAGDGPMRKELERAIAEAGLTERTRITGWISGAEVRAIVEESGLFVLPSFAEGLPVVIMEAMALARPVISTMIAGIPELVQHGTTGWLVPAGDVQALAGAISTALGLPEETLTAMGTAARKRVLERHDIRREAEKLLRLFQNPPGAA